MSKNLTAIFQPWFVITLCIALLHQIVQKVGKISLPIIDYYLDPLLLMPILLHLVLWEKRIVFRKGNSYTLPLPNIIVITVFVSVISEYAFPLWNNRFIADSLDVICYAIGAIFFFVFFNTPIKNNRR